jgi:3-methylcrotonyl-CoA carboxylase alpha subunit
MNALFGKILIANRGEIACRVIRTCQALGIKTVAVYSEADRDAEHVLLADEAVFIGPSEAAQSYLDKQAVLNAALASQAKAIHPGYGFLSENAEFAEMVDAAGLVFIGPRALSMRAMGSKAGAKALMTAHGVPVIPGYSGDNQDPDVLLQEANAIGYPLMIKAAHGGGGKGMRIVHEAEAFPSALQSCQREAKNAFGKDRVLLERYIDKPRHIEFQIFADTHGNTLHLGERECSAQRRFQKVIEESPSPFLSSQLRADMAEAAIKAAKAVDYLNAGTVEFIVSPNGDFYFMEINSRLQVEHPVTEMVTGFDLVRWQIEVAAGLPLRVPQHDIVHRGHAIEVRLYAEDPDRHFMPGSGLIEKLFLPETSKALRIDSGFREGNRVSVFYDPMLAKLIVWGENRTLALAALQQALSQCQIFGLPSNIRFLEQLAAHPVVQSAEIDTGYLDRHLDQVLAIDRDTPDSHQLAAAYFSFRQASADTGQPSGHSPWGGKDFWRLHGQGAFRIHLKNKDGFEPYRVRLFDKQLVLETHGRILSAKVIVQADETVCLQIDGLNHLFHAFRHRDELVVHDGQTRSHWHVLRAGASAKATTAEQDGFIRAPMPGKLVVMKVAAGQCVVKDQELAIMEAMKMELSLKAPCAGTISECLAETGKVLDADAPILSWVPADG